MKLLVVGRVELWSVCDTCRTSIMILTFSQYLRNFKIPCFIVTPQRKCSRVAYPLFSLFPVSS